MASILWLPVVFTACSSLLYWLSTSLPALPTEGISVNSTALKFPATLDELRDLATLLEHYRVNHMTYVLALYSTAYLFKQAFAIPGSIFLNLLGGALFGQWYGFILTCLLSASGATCCYLLAKICGRSYIVKYFPDKLQFIQSKIEQNADSLFFFLMFLRLFPMTPNWFLNMASPICGVPAHLFFLSVFFGLMPYNFISVQTGCLLSQLTSMDSVFTPWTMLKLFAMATAALVPGLCIKKYQEHRSNKQRKLEAEKEAAAKAKQNEQAEQMQLISPRARKRLAFQARSKSTDQKGAEIDVDFYNSLVDEYYAVRQRKSEKLKSELERVAEHVAEPQEVEVVDPEPLAEKIEDASDDVGELKEAASAPPQLEDEQTGEDLAKTICVEDISVYPPVEELKFTAVPENVTNIDGIYDSDRNQDDIETEIIEGDKTGVESEEKSSPDCISDVEASTVDKEVNEHKETDNVPKVDEVIEDQPAEGIHAKEVEADNEEDETESATLSVSPPRVPAPEDDESNNDSSIAIETNAGPVDDKSDPESSVDTEANQVVTCTDKDDKEEEFDIDSVINEGPSEQGKEILQREVSNLSERDTTDDSDDLLEDMVVIDARDAEEMMQHEVGADKEHVAEENAGEMPGPAKSETTREAIEDNIDGAKAPIEGVVPQQDISKGDVGSDTDAHHKKKSQDASMQVQDVSDTPPSAERPVEKDMTTQSKKIDGDKADTGKNT